MDKNTTVLNSEEQSKKEALRLVLERIQKQFGKGAIMRLGEEANINIESISTGALSLDISLGIGGLPRGRIIEIYGPESSGKTTLAIHTIAEAQKFGGEAAFIDAEHALDIQYAKKLGVNLDNLVISQPDTGEQALEIVEQLSRSGAVDIIVVDSVAALVPRQEIDGEMGDIHVGLQARMMSQALRKISGVVNKSNVIVIFINQLRDKIGVMYGPSETTTGGKALKFYASVRLDIRKSEALKNGTDIIGNRVKVKVVKNKVAPPFRVAEFDIMYGEGISKEGSILDVATDLNIVRRSGAWFYYGEQKLAQGRDNAKKYLKENPELLSTIKDLVMAEVKKCSHANDNLKVNTNDIIKTPIDLSDTDNAN